MNLPELTKLVLLGTERQAMPKTEARSALEQWQAQINPIPGEQALLSAAALASVHEQVGRLPARHTPALPTPCAGETLPLAGQRAGELLLNIQSGQYPEFLAEWLALAGRHGRLAPPETLPDLLAAGSTQPELCDLIPPVLGERGRWLAAQNAEWSWVRGADDLSDDVWHTGDRKARQLFLKRLRSQDAARARGLLTAGWPAESPDDRLALIEALEDSLTPVDEPFLETALDDKRKEVRRLAATLLARLPDSALVKRMTARVTPLLNWNAGKPSGMFGLKKAEPPVLEVVLPAECDKAMQRDGIEIKPPPGTGEKAWWLRQMLEVVPLSHWTSLWPARAVDILNTSLTGEWKQDFYHAWTRAAARQRNAEWAQLLFPIAVKGKHQETSKNLLAVLPPTDAEKRIIAMLASPDANIQEMQGFLVMLCQHAWSADFSRNVLDWLRALSATISNDWQLRGQLKHVAGRLSPEVLLSLSAGWPMEAPGWEFWGKSVEELLAAARFRHDMIQAFTTTDSTLT